MRYDPEFARRVLEFYPAGTEVEKALHLAELYGKKAQMEAALENQKKGGSPYRSEGKSIADLLDDVCTPRTELVKYDQYDRASRVYSVDDYFLGIENVQCVDADGKVFEQYARLLVDKDVVRGNSDKPVNFTPYRAIIHFEEKKFFLPSFALTCNIIAALYQHKDDPEVKPVLDQYKDNGARYGWHAQNTVIDYNTQKIIHYPRDADFSTSGGTGNVNTARSPVKLPFEKIKKNGFFSRDNVLRNKTLEEGLQDPLIAPFVRQLTGLADPSDLVKVGQYFGKPAKVWFPTDPVKAEDCTETRAAWFGCYSSDLYLYGSYDLYSSLAVRGVKRAEAP